MPAVPQQTGTNCAIFVIEFIRAFLNGHRPGHTLSSAVSESQMTLFRSNIEQEVVVNKKYNPAFVGSNE